MKATKTTVKANVSNSQRILFAAAKTEVTKERLESLLSQGIISYRDYVEGNPSSTDTERADAFITYSVGKVIPCAPTVIKEEVKNILRCVSTDYGATKMVGRLERRSPWSYEYSVRVAIMAAAMGIYLGKFSSLTQSKKRGKLTNEEYETIKHHTDAGYRYLKEAGFDEDIAQIALLHHERHDGSGYFGISELPKTVEVVAIADTIDAMSAARPYKNATEIGEAIVRLRDEYESDRCNLHILKQASKLMVI